MREERKKMKNWSICIRDILWFIFILFYFLFYFHFNFSLLILYVCFEWISTKEIKISKNKDNHTEHDFSKIIENCLISIYKNIPRRLILVAQIIDPTVLYIQNFHSCIPLAPAINGTNDLVKLWNFPKTIYQNQFFRFVFREFLFCSSKANIVSVFFDNLMSVPFSYPIANIVTNHRS